LEFVDIFIGITAWERLKAFAGKAKLKKFEKKSAACWKAAL